MRPLNIFNFISLCNIKLIYIFAKSKDKDMDKGKQWGGRREGAGRKKTSVNQYTFRADKLTAEIIERQPNKTDLIRMCVHMDGCG